ncbi:MAG: serine hydrolase [Gammaproteobacteria bacterium]
MSFFREALKRILFGCLLLSINCFAEVNNNSSIVKKLNDISRATNSIIGVSAIYLETNQKVSYNGNVPFFMASTIKVPIAVAFLHRVDENQDSLDHVVRLSNNNSIPGSGSLYHSLNKGYVDISLGKLLRLMLTISDNSASDAILREVNGPVTVSRMLHAYGLDHIMVRRSLLHILVDENGANPDVLNQSHTSKYLEKIFGQVPIAKKLFAWKQFQNDPRDTTTPDDMVMLLVKLYNRELLSDDSTDLLLGIMERCQTGKTRIKKLLPSGTKVAHKTGSWAIYSRNILKHPGSKQLFRFASDVGIISLPRDQGHIVIAVYVKSRGVSDHVRSRAIALASRAVYDHLTRNG